MRGDLKKACSRTAPYLRVWLPFFALGLALAVCAPGAAAQANTELGAQDDLTVLGTSATAPDPDVEIKGFTVFGATQAAYTGAIVGPGNVLVNGALAVSSGAYVAGLSTFTGGVYFTANSSFPAAGNIFITDGTAGQVLRKNGAGYLEWVNSSAMGDNLGNHLATNRLDMANNPIVGVSSMNLTASGLSGSSPVLQVAGSTFQVNNAGNVLIGSNTDDGSGSRLQVSGSAVLSAAAAKLIVKNTNSNHILNNANSHLVLDNTNVNGQTIFVFSNNGNPNGGARGDFQGNFSWHATGPQGHQFYNSLDISIPVMGVGASGVVIGGIAGAAAGTKLDVIAAGTDPDTFAQFWRDSDENIVSSLSATGVMMAAKFVGDGSGLTNLSVTGDHLGNHTATQSVNLNGNWLSGDGDAEGIFVNTDGSIGVNTVPGATLHAYTDASGAGAVQGRFENVNEGGRSQFIINSGAYPSNFFSLMTHGTAFGSDHYLSDATSDAGLGILLGQGASMSKFAVGTYNAAPLSFFTNNRERLYLNSAGNVGIGTTAPLSKFDVFGGSITVRGTNAGVVFTDSTRVISPETSAALGAGVRVSTNVYIVGFASATNVYANNFYGNGSGLTGITGDNLGSHVATTTLQMGTFNIADAGSITANGAVTTYSTMTVAGNIGAYGLSVSSNIIVAGGVFNTLNGKVGIGTTAPTFDLDVRTNSVNAFYVAQDNNTRYLRFDGGGFVNNTTLAVSKTGWSGYAALEVGTVIPSRRGIHIQQVADQTANSLETWDNANNPLAYISSSGGAYFAGNVGIRTTAPGAAIDVVSTGTAHTQFAQIWRNTSEIISSMSATGVMMASRFVGDGSGLTGVPGDNLGSHVATKALNLADNPIANVSSMTITGAGLAGASPIFTVASSTFNILANGNIGIGNPAPAYKLSVGGATQLDMDTSQAGKVVLRVAGVAVAEFLPD